jgi:endonuclease YncB( thermonuclease family)
VEILRATTVDPYGRTLAYVFLDGRNYSTMIIAARLAEETISQFGDNGFPKEAADVKAAAKAAGPMAFESPSRYRTRMRDLSRWLKARGQYPK